MISDFRRLTLIATLSSSLFALAACGEANNAAPANTTANDTPSASQEQEQEQDNAASQDSPAAGSDDDAIRTGEGSDWTIDPEASSIRFTFESYGNEGQGTFTSWSAAITSGPEDLENANAAVIVNVDSIETGDEERDLTAAGPAYLDSQEHPVAVFETTGFRKTAEGTYEADANLSMNGVTQPITFPFTLSEEGNTVRVQGSVPFQRESFGVGEAGAYQEAGPEITVLVDLTATRR